MLSISYSGVSTVLLLLNNPIQRQLYVLEWQSQTRVHLMVTCRPVAGSPGLGPSTSSVLCLLPEFERWVVVTPLSRKPAAGIYNMLGTRPAEPTSSLARSMQQAKHCGLQRDRYGTQ